VGRLFVAFAGHLKEHGGGRVFVAPFDVVLSQFDVAQPDIVFVAVSDEDVITDANIRGTPTLAIEILSDPRHDRVRKRDLYARAGIPEYWIVDPDADRVEVYRLGGSSYAKPKIVEAGDSLSPTALPDLRIDISAVLAR
jgi:Uma2 family endonuclease